MEHVCQVTKNKLSASLPHSHQAKLSLLCSWLAWKGKRLSSMMWLHFSEVCKRLI